MKNNLKSIRTAAGLTQEALAELMGTSKSYISQLESGQRNIMQIRSDTMLKLCNALGCKQEDLHTLPNIEFDGKFLIVDDYFYDKRQNKCFIEIDGTYFAIDKIPFMATPQEMKENLVLLPYYTKPDDAMELEQYNYWLDCLMPRTGFVVNIGREITECEMNSLKTELNIAEDNISDEFVVSVGSVYGEKYAKTYTAVQIKVFNSKINVVSVETELKNKGIEASSVASDCINIRVK